jgi:hypothetical protein
LRPELRWLEGGPPAPRRRSPASGLTELTEGVGLDAQATIPTPDTGSLRSDLATLLDSVVAVYSSPEGQTLLRMLTLQDAHTFARHEFLQRRFDLARAIFDRAILRGEFPSDRDGMIVLEALLAPLVMRVLLKRPLNDWPRNEMLDRLLS